MTDLAAPPSPTSRNASRAYVLALLTLVYTFNHIDRQVLVILLEPIKADLKLDDAQLGLLTGLAFAAFYATLGIPMAMWADRGDHFSLTGRLVGHDRGLRPCSEFLALAGRPHGCWCGRSRRYSAGHIHHF